MAKTHFGNGEFERGESSSKEGEYPHHVLVSDIIRTLKCSGSPLSPECCIYMVRKKIRSVNEAAYTPQVVSIGPLHHGAETLREMEKHKLWYLEKFLERAGNKASLKDFVSTIKGWELSIRSCYAETFDHLSSDKFVKMILVDAGFIIELFIRESEPRILDQRDDPILYIPWRYIDIEQDLILLENQLPFFVLEGLYDLAFPPNSNNFPSFLDLTCYHFSYYNHQNKSIGHKVEHFTDLLRFFQLPTPQIGSGSNFFLDSDNIIDHLHTATELHASGVKFKVSPSKCLLDIKFSNGVFEIPRLKLYDNTEPFIRNLMALEQCHYPWNTYVCNYVKVMDHLINTTKDVHLLVRNKIIVNHLGDQGSVATLFNNLCTHIAIKNDSSYIRICKDVNKYYEIRCHRWQAILRHEYFSTPWRIASIIAAFILLVLTLTQTICNIISL